MSKPELAEVKPLKEPDEEILAEWIQEVRDLRAQRRLQMILVVGFDESYVVKKYADCRLSEAIGLLELAKSAIYRHWQEGGE